MKLLTKSSIYFISVTAVLFILNAFIIYQCILNKFDSEINEDLHLAKNNIIINLKNGYDPQDIVAKTDKSKSIKEIDKQTIFADKYIVSSVSEEYEEGEEEEEEEKVSVKTLLFQTKIKDKIYEVKIASSLTEGSEISETIILIVLICLLVSLLILFLVNRMISRVIWSPFTDTLEQIGQWRLKSKKALQFKKTDINEFNLLNESLNTLMIQIKNDYLHLKEFTENVSHEAQTPLAIISNKLELLLQENNYSQSQTEQLHQSYQAVQRLYKLNKALILLSRIENKQFDEIQTLNLNNFIYDKIIELEDFIEAKKITIHKEFIEDCILEISPTLLGILIDNLFNNAIKYNLNEQGTITIKISKNSFSFENTSVSNKLDDVNLFERVTKKSTSNSLGIGLSLIKKIIELYKWDVNYIYTERLHKFEIYFFPDKKSLE
jgi:signal transduction histidine kinase